MVRELLSLIIAGGAFCGSHVLLSSTRLRGSLRDQLGERGFLAVYSVTALVIFAWFVSAYAGAPTIVLWPTQRPPIRRPSAWSDQPGRTIRPRAFCA
jgi:hypothetical protein